MKGQEPEIAAALQRAVALHQRGQLAEAEPLYRAILAKAPDHFDALHLLGVMESQRRRYEAAVELIGQALKRNPSSAPAHMNLGVAQQNLGRRDDALASFDRALAIKPDFADAFVNRGNVLRGLGRAPEALASYDRALAIKPDSAEALINRGAALSDLKRPEDALASFDRALALRPNHPDALRNRGDVLFQLGHHEEALASYDRLLGLRPDDATVLSARGIVLSELGRYDEALASYDRSLALRPDDPDTLNNRGNALGILDRCAEALGDYDRALALRPDFSEALNNRGIALRNLDRRDEALLSFGRALAVRPDYVDALNNRGNVLRYLQRHEEAAADFARLLRHRPDFDYAMGDKFSSQLHGCDWRDYEQERTLIADRVGAGERAAKPFAFLSASDSAELQLRCARTFCADRFPAAPRPVWGGERYAHDKIRVAYLSADFHGHATTYLISQLIEAHDKSRFETTAISFGPAAADESRARLEASFDRFLDVRAQSDRDVALLLRGLEIDIAVDLKGYTQDFRLGIFAHRPAPVQVNYLGYPGTLGADYIDYILADRVVIPEDQRPFYSEKIVSLPDTYQPNDRQRRIAARTPTRAEAGLPQTGFVFCSFNNVYKITPPVFDIWMRLLGEIQGSVLWLLEGDAAALRNLRREAERRGIAPARLVFAPAQKLEDHLARHRLAGLMLDTVPINAHTTASDALWAGLPLVTCLGSSFASRVAGSLLTAVGLPELIASDLAGYHALALGLARDENKLAALAAKLARNRDTCPLFDAQRLCRHIESAYETMWARSQRGEPPSHFAVAPIP